MELKKTATKLRRRGLSYNEIRHHVPVAKSTLSLWLKDIRLKKEHRERLYTKQIAILALGPQSQKERRAREIEEIIQGARREISLPIPLDAYRLMGAALYWAEGGKTSGFEVTNSDPRLILFFVKWLEKIFGIPAINLKAWLNIYPQQNEVKIKKFWSDLTGIPYEKFGKSYTKPASKGYKKNNLYYGTIKVDVPKGSNMRHRLFGWVQAALQDIEPKVKLTERKWLALRQVARPVNIAPHNLMVK